MINAPLFSLIQAIQLLAADCETQLNHFPEFVHVPDELALTYSDSLLLVDQQAVARLISQQEQVKNNFANNGLDKMSIASNGHIKTCPDPLGERSDVYAKLNQLDNILEKMSQTEELWTVTALKKAPEWQQIRLLARELLSLFSQKLQVTHLSWVKYAESTPSAVHAAYPPPSYAAASFTMPNLQARAPERERQGALA